MSLNINLYFKKMELSTGFQRQYRFWTTMMMMTTTKTTMTTTTTTTTSVAAAIITTTSDNYHFHPTPSFNLIYNTTDKEP